VREVVKRLLYAPLAAVMWPVAALSGFGRVVGIYRMFAQLWALIPGIPGNYLRNAYYRWTLDGCEFSSRISFGTFFAHRQSRVGRRVYIGPYCLLGQCSIGDNTQIAGQVQILSGKRQHRRGADGAISGGDEGHFEVVPIGSNCWIGAGAIIMAAVGDNTTIGAGAVVTKPIPAGVVAVGNPARVLRTETAEGDNGVMADPELRRS
jgi:virginiamycin A acetyltransferase